MENCPQRCRKGIGLRVWSEEVGELFPTKKRIHSHLCADVTSSSGECHQAEFKSRPIPVSLVYCGKTHVKEPLPRCVTDTVPFSKYMVPSSSAWHLSSSRFLELKCLPTDSPVFIWSCAKVKKVQSDSFPHQDWECFFHPVCFYRSGHVA